MSGMDNTSKVFWMVFVVIFASRGVMSIPSFFHFGNTYVTGLFHGVGISILLFAVCWSFYAAFKSYVKNKKESKKESEET